MRFKGPATNPGDGARDPLSATLWGLRSRFAWVVGFSIAVNLLYLASPLYMLQVYDRALVSGSVATLVFITLILLLALGTLSLLDAVRARILVITAEEVDDRLIGKLLGALVRTSAGSASARSEALREFDFLRRFISGQGLQAFLDVPWTFVFIAACFLLHVWIGVFAMVASAVVFGAAFLNERSLRKRSEGAHEGAARTYAATDSVLKSSEAVRALGMQAGVIGKWLGERQIFGEQAVTAARQGAEFSSLTKFLRLTFQSLALGLGAYLAIQRQITPGAIIASSILVGRALSPLEQISGGWRSATLIAPAYRRLARILSAGAETAGGLRLPRPRGRLSIERALVTAPDDSRIILRQVSLELTPGQVVGVIGRSGAGKSTLARAAVGAWPLRSGTVRLDGADIAQIDPDDLGRLVGYVPQDVALLPGTIRDNISRFARYESGSDSDAIDEAVLKAAQLAGLDDLIRRLPEQYATELRADGAPLSGGQRQRVALARALYGSPPIMVLDEPNANLDGEGERALAQALNGCKNEGCAILLIGHSNALHGQIDRLLVMDGGAIQDEGPRDEVLARLQARPVPVPLRGGAA